MFKLPLALNLALGWKFDMEYKFTVIIGDMATGKLVVAAGFIIYRRIESKIQYLLLQTSYGENHWTPPKGHVDPGESEMETALRETEEEAGLTGSTFTIDSEFKKEQFYDVRGKPKKVIYWLACLKDPETPVKLSDEHIDYKWLELAEACSIVKYSDMQETLTEAESKIK